MQKLIIVEKPEAWSMNLDEVEVIIPERYISEEIYQ
jgi:hypothetical protein